MHTRKGLMAFLSALLVLGVSTALGGDWPWLKKAKPGEQNSLEEVARAIDCLEEKILDDGTVVIKRPDVYGQARMTIYRKNFEQQMYGAITKFNAVTSARLYRSDQAALSSQTNVAAGLASSAPQAKSSTSTTTNVVTPTLIPAPSSGGITPDGLATASIVRPTTIAPEFGTSPFSFSGISGTAGTVGLDPTVYLDELKDYQDHLNQIRRTNMGDDTADSAGYGLYLIRMPVSIQPGECTRSGHGAIVTATVRHDFGTDFLPSTFRNLVVNDLVDQLTPVIFEMIRANALKKDFLPGLKNMSPLSAEDQYKRYLTTNADPSNDLYAIFDDPKNSTLTTREEKIAHVSDLMDRMTAIYGTFTRINNRSLPIPGTEFDNVFLEQNLVILALSAKQASQTVTPRSTDVRAFLRLEVEAAYDVISQLYANNDPESAQIVAGFETSVERIGQHIRTKEFRSLYEDYRVLASYLPGELRYMDVDATGQPLPIRDPKASLVDPLTILCYSIAVEAGFLDRQLKVDMKRVFSKDGGDCSDVDMLRFYSAKPDPEAVTKFEEYVRKRWPLITFALYPQVDQQNLDDISSTSRDLQLALAFAFSSGQINFQQLLQFQRKVTTDAEAVTLNRTVTSFSHGNDTFGYRFTPRYQNPPPEKSNFAVLANTLIKGGQGRDYRIKNSQLEGGQRELNAVIIMPSFLHGIQMDVTGNWFPLHDPDQMKTSTPRMIEQGRKVVELKEALNCIHEHKTYRKGDIQRLTTRVGQLEAMLPMQTQEINLPYENTLGGFQLFQQGTTALVPQLDAFEGVDTIDGSQDVDLLLYGKHFSIQETYIVVGGTYLQLPSINTDPTGSTPAQAPAPAPVASAPVTPATPKIGAAPVAPVVPGAAPVTPATPVAPVVPGAAPVAPVAPAAPSSPKSTATIDVVSRNVMRVHIPKGLVPTDVLDADGTISSNYYVELYVATPNGISNRLLIPYKPNSAANPGPSNPKSQPIMPDATLSPSVIPSPAPRDPSVPSAPAPAPEAPPTNLVPLDPNKPNPPTPDPSIPPRTGRAAPARDPSLKPSGYRPAQGGPLNLPPLPAGSRPPSAPKAASTTKATTAPKAKKAAEPVETPADGKWHLPWRRQAAPAPVTGSGGKSDQ